MKLTLPPLPPPQHNLASVIDAHPEALAVAGHTLRDGSLKAQAADIENGLLAANTAKLVEEDREFAKARGLWGGIWS